LNTKKTKTIPYAIKCRIYPNEEQKQFFAKQFGCSRLIYNIALDWMIFHYDLTGRSISIYDAKKLLPFLKQSSHYSFLKEVNSQSLQAAVLNLGKGFDRFYTGKSNKPIFKKKTSRQCFEVPQHFVLKKSKKGNDFLILPKVKTAIKIKIHRKIEGKVRHIDVSIEPDGKYHAILTCMKEVVCAQEALSQKDFETAGFDLGLTDFLVDSNGKKTPSPQYLRKSEEKLKKKQRAYANKVSGSKNQEKARKEVAKLQAKIKNQRNDFQHKLSYEIVDKNQGLYFENLSPRNMMKNPRLSKSIGDSGWGLFVTKVKYKAYWRDKEFIQIGRFEPTSKLCSNCGAINNELKLHHRMWKCKTCDVLHDRDINAAKNIKKIGQEMSKLTPVDEDNQCLSSYEKSGKLPRHERSRKRILSANLKMHGDSSP